MQGFTIGSYERYARGLVNDDLWGGFVPGTKKLAETTKVYLAISDILFAFGGGGNTAVTLAEARVLGIPNEYFPFEMNHEKAIKLNKGKEMDFRGEAFSVGMKKNKLN